MKTNAPKTGYLPSLDGWRCVAILGVMWAHDARYVIRGHHTEFWQGLGGYGVILFFALSGVLISWRILQDERRQGYFSLRTFYIRRFFRIQPPQWVYLAVVALLMGLRVMPLARWKYWWAALLMYENFLWHTDHVATIVPASYLVGHFWTLAVEEHFYLLISLFFFLVKRRRPLVLGLLLALLLLWQQVALALHLWSSDVSNRRTYWEIQWLIFPALVTLLLRQDAVIAFAKRWCRPWVAFVCTLILMGCHQLLLGVTDLRPKPLLIYSSGVLFYAFTGWVIATMLHPLSWTTRFLELPPLRFIGRLSYSLYLWHLLFFGGGQSGGNTFHLLAQLNRPPLHYLCSFVMALLSYYLVEKPMIRLGHRLAPAASPGHKDLSAHTPLLSLT